MENFDEFATDWSRPFQIDINNLEGEVIKQAASYSYYGARCAKAKAVADFKKYTSERKLIDVKTLLSELMVIYSQEVIGYTSKGEAKYRTAQAIDAAAKSDSRYLKLMAEYYEVYEEYLKTKEIADLYEVDVRSSAQKGDCLKSLSFNLHRELMNKDVGGI